MENTVQASWLDKEEYPFQSNYFELDKCRMHYVEEGSGKTVLFVHGTPSWSFECRNIIKDLRVRFKCVAPDHIGFGLSDKPKEYNYGIKQHCQNLEKFILSKGYEQITLVVHDFGGPIGLNFAIRHPRLVAKIVVMNSWLWSQKNDAKFKRFSRMQNNPLLPFLYRYLNFSARFVLPRAFGEKKIKTSLLKQFTGPFRNWRQREGTIGFVNSLLRIRNGLKIYGRKKKSFQKNRPCLFGELKTRLLVLICWRSLGLLLEFIKPFCLIHAVTFLWKKILVRLAMPWSIYFKIKPPAFRLQYLKQGLTFILWKLLKNVGLLQNGTGADLF